MFRHSADKAPVAVILAFTCMDIAAYLLIDNLWWLTAYWLLLIFPKINICAWNHHHQHSRTFTSRAMNRLLEFFYALHTGVTTNLWVLHHVLGHHHHFLDQTKDESRWKRDNGEIMGEWEYAFTVAATAYQRGFMVGKRYPKVQKEFLLFSAITFAIVAALVIYRPLPALFIIVLPMICGLLFTSWVTYSHHAGLDTPNAMEASYNNLHPLHNLFTGNLGYHTAHHYKQGVHWSELPALHETIKDQIPEQLIQKHWF